LPTPDRRRRRRRPDLNASIVRMLEDQQDKEIAAGGVDPAEFRRVMGHFATGVAILTSKGKSGPCGLTLTAVTSVSLIPPLVLVCVDRSAYTNACIREEGAFGLNFLEEGRGESLSRRFSEPLVRDKFEGVAYRYGSLGAAVLEQALCWMQCRVTQSHEAGDHTIFIGEVVEADAREGRPLVYYRGGYGRFEP
jgi:flavin reductase (DIM6/NTAB) family NADH-FMN oxidoreductase RutF